MVNGWLIYNKADATKNEDYIAWFKREATKQNIALQLIYREELTISIDDGVQQVFLNDQKVSLPHFVIIRTIEPILQSYFEACSVLTFNNMSTSRICNDKSWTHVEVNKLNIPMVTTIFATKHNAPKKSPLPYPVIIKEVTGRSGKQVHFISNELEWKKCISALTTNDFIIQATNVKLGQDVRVFVIGKEIIGAVLRKNDHDFRANYKLGGKAIPFSLSPEQIEMIQKIIHHFDFGLVGIDFLMNEYDELIFNEIEDVVGSRILSEVSDINLLEKYVTFIKSHLDDFVNH